jgi:hypothetical protein
MRPGGSSISGADLRVLAANDNGFSPNLQIAVWKMLRAGMPQQVILSTFGVTEGDLTKLQAKNK